MGEIVNRTAGRYYHSLVEWLSSQNFRIILVLSLLHIGLAYIHAQHSGRADYLTSADTHPGC